MKLQDSFGELSNAFRNAEAATHDVNRASETASIKACKWQMKLIENDRRVRRFLLTFYASMFVFFIWYCLK